MMWIVYVLAVIGAMVVGFFCTMITMAAHEGFKNGRLRRITKGCSCPYCSGRNEITAEDIGLDSKHLLPVQDGCNGYCCCHSPASSCGACKCCVRTCPECGMRALFHYGKYAHWYNGQAVCCLVYKAKVPASVI